MYLLQFSLSVSQSCYSVYVAGYFIITDVTDKFSTIFVMRPLTPSLFIARHHEHYVYMYRIEWYDTNLLQVFHAVE